MATRIIAGIIGLALMSVAAIGPNSSVQAQDFKFLLWQKKVADKIGKNQRYPRSAVRKGIEGSAQIRLKVKKSGEILGFEIVKSSGADVLDREIGKLVNRINPLPEVPGEEQEVFLTLPLNWTLSN